MIWCLCPFRLEITSPYTDHYVPIGHDAVVRTIAMEAETTTTTTTEMTMTSSLQASEGKTPLVMIHGFGAGLLQFYKNFDHLHADRRLLAFDLPGFGRSSRVAFPRDPEGAESQFVDIMEKWRAAMGVRCHCGIGGGRGLVSRVVDILMCRSLL